MSPLEEFERRLRARREELRRAAQAGLRAMGETLSARDVGDVEDEALAEWMRTQQVAVLRLDAEELNDIEEALGRIRDGTYGTCADCGAEIPPERLKAYPTAKRCLACQASQEKQRRP